MPFLPRALATAALLLSTAGAAHAATVRAVEIRGLDEVMSQNVRVSLSLVDAIDKELSGRRLAYLLREAEDETREALEPFGYYSPTITVQRTRDGVTTVVGDPATPAPATATATAATGEADADEADTRRAANTSPVTVTISVELGTPVTVRDARVAIEGAGGDDRYLKRDLGEFKPQAGDVFDHEVYETSKARITRRLAERGYFDADFASRRVEVTRAQHAADIELVWSSGERYDMGPTTFEQTPKRIIRESLLERLVYWEVGSYYHQGKLDRLRESLARLDYFASIDIAPHPEDAVDGEVPVTVTLTPAKRSIYTAGLSYGTDSGAGVRLGGERRYLNDRGHKALAQIDWAERRKTLTGQYRIPAFAYLDGWYTLSAQAADEQTDYIDNRRIELVASRSGELNPRWTAVASLHALRERWAYTAEDDGDPLTPPMYRYATFSYPSLRGEYIDADDRIHPRDGLGGTLMLRGGVEGAGSDVSFAQVHASARWYRGLGPQSRLITRGELGHTFVDARIGTLPPSLRFHAGGDRSIRGYAWREVGPRIGPAGDQFPVGARNVATGSVEYEQYFGRGEWGAAAFLDGGSAFNDSPVWRTGVGVGLRWKSPVGPVRIDVAHGLDDPDSSFQLYLNIGADL
ncbi:autotransporter assembly complex family protein [Lysobacter koreensis]|uniref:Translocation and assembly module subunit TamA n=1 Tax=Lysobacter koreensis TaxID=266122 RepID=A0ABW2YMM6_9GAMM